MASDRNSDPLTAATGQYRYPGGRRPARTENRSGASQPRAEVLSDGDQASVDFWSGPSGLHDFSHFCRFFASRTLGWVQKDSH